MGDQKQLSDAFKCIILLIVAVLVEFTYRKNMIKEMSELRSKQEYLLIKFFIRVTQAVRSCKKSVE